MTSSGCGRGSAAAQTGKSRLLGRFVVCSLLFLGGCFQQPEQEPIENPAASEPQIGQVPESSAAPTGPDAGSEDRTPVSEERVDPGSASGARRRLQTYFELLNIGRTDEADRFWRAGENKESFDARLAKYSEVHANIGAPGELRGAAGSVYVEIPVELQGRSKEGEEMTERGAMILRRSNDVPGSTAEQRAWDIYRSDFTRR